MASDAVRSSSAHLDSMNAGVEHDDEVGFFQYLLRAQPSCFPGDRLLIVEAHHAVAREPAMTVLYLTKANRNGCN